MHGNNDRARAVEASLVAAAQDLSKTRHSRDQVAPLTMVAQKVGSAESRPLFGAVAMKKILPAMLMFTLVVLFAVVQYAAAAPSPP